MDLPPISFDIYAKFERPNFYEPATKLLKSFLDHSVKPVFNNYSLSFYSY
mgnify:CR=1 FL=1